MTIEELVSTAQAGDTQAFTEICAKFDNLAKKYAYQPHLQSMREDALAAARLAIVEAIKSYDPATGIFFAAYAKTKVHYRLWNIFKHERRYWQTEVMREFSPDDPAEEQPMADFDTAAQALANITVDDLILRRELKAALASLPAKQQRVVLGVVAQGCTLQTLATELKISVQAVYRLKERGLANLRRRLEALAPDKQEY